MLTCVKCSGGVPDREDEVVQRAISGFLSVEQVRSIEALLGTGLSGEVLHPGCLVALMAGAV